MKAQFLATTAIAAMLAGCSTAYGEEVETVAEAAQPAVTIPQGSGYFASDSDLPFLTPDFTQITEDDYVPAFEQGMAIQKAEVEAITSNPAAPNFENTIVALEKSGRMLGRVANVFFALTGANTMDRLDEINTQISPKLSAHFDSITLNPELFVRVKAVYDSRASMAMTREDAKLLEETYKDMVHAGALLTEAERERVKEINSQLSKLTTEFSQKVRTATVGNALIVDTAEELAGLSQVDIESAAKLATDKGHEGKFAIALQNTTRHPLNPVLENRETREKLYWASYHRADVGGE
ncbi:MAG TPA: dipeptidyl carboxypeptidase II, partial [Erythrobacter sp.]|nr:dipeptidyl carboxypeptidase II [Erythrobacter sp.]